MRSITFAIPTIRFSFSSAQKVSQLFLTTSVSILKSAVLSLADFAGQGSYTQLSNNRTRLGSLRRKITNNKKFFKYIPLGILLLIVVISVGLFLRSDRQSVMGVSDMQENITIEDAKAVQDINKSFSFPVLNDAGKEVGKVDYIIEKAELRDQLIIKGQQARAIGEKDFLILSLKLRNDTEHTISVQSRDFVRLKMEGTSEQFAPTIHNDPVEVQAISTLTTRIGFSINEKDTGFKLLIGEITGKKQTVDLKFQ